jgi:hypothetical protein
MAGIYKLWFMNFKEPWYALNEVKQNELMGKVMKAQADFGGRLVINCASDSEKWLVWGIEEFPDLATQQKHSLALFNMNWFRYVNSWSILGSKRYPDGEVVIEKAPIYKVAIFRYNESFHTLSQEQRLEQEIRTNSLHTRFGSKTILSCFTSWSDEQWMAFVLESYPSEAALIDRHEELAMKGWYQFAHATSMLGVRWPIE